MPRAGAGGGSNRSSSGHNANSRKSSGHRPTPSGSGMRAGGGGIHNASGRSTNFGNPAHGGIPRGGMPPFGSPFGGNPNRSRYGNPIPGSGAPFGMPPVGPPMRTTYRRTPAGGGPFIPYSGRTPQRHRSGCLTSVLAVFAVIIIAVIVIAMTSCSHQQSSPSNADAAIPASTYNRTKLDSGLAYNTNCIDDELGWFTNVSSAEKKLKVFYDKTGIQPYVLFAKYNSQLTSDTAKQQWAEDWYDQNIDNEDTLLFVYFAEQDVDNDVGYMTLVNGKNISSIMDSQATEIFWDYLDKYWFSNLSTDDAIVQTFDSTADRIMTKTTTKNDVQKWVIIAVIVIIVLAVAILVIRMLMKRKREHEQYVERMVNTPVQAAQDPILEKYDQPDHEVKGQ